MIKKLRLIALIVSLMVILNTAIFNSTAISGDKTYIQNNNPENWYEYADIEVSVEPKDEEQLRREIEDLAYEIDSLREENVKHFALGDGSYTAVVYSVPVHRADETGKWQNIDNTLIQSGNDAATKDLRVKFSKKITGEETLFTLHENNRKISMGLRGAIKKTEGTVENISPENADDATELQKLINFSGLESKIIYKNILDGVDIEYILSSNNIKENIIVNKRSDSYSYTFTIDLNNLTAEKCEDGGIRLYDPISGEEVYTIPAPYMYDCAGESSLDVYYTLEEVKNGKYELTLTASDEWMNSPDREYPIVIDPTLIDLCQTADTYISSSTPTKGYGSAATARVSATEEAYYKFYKPELPTGVSITNASIKLQYYVPASSSEIFSLDDGISPQAVQIGITVGIYQVTSSWNEYGLNWNNKPTYNTTALSSKSFIPAGGITASSPGTASFTVTSAVASWYTGTAPNGFVLKRTGGAEPLACFGTRESSMNNAQLIINYSGTKFAEGIYAIKKSTSNTYARVPSSTSSGYVYQGSYASAPTTSTSLQNLFKINYRPATDDYIIRSMLNNELVLVPDSPRPQIIVSTKTDASLPASSAWKIVPVGSYYYITSSTTSSTEYYLQSTSDSSSTQLTTTTNSLDVGTKWSFVQYTGNVIDNLKYITAPGTVYVGQQYTYKAVMSCSRRYLNGPVKYSVSDTNMATITSAGVLTPKKAGTFKVGATYNGAPWVWNWTVKVYGNTTISVGVTNVGHDHSSALHTISSNFNACGYKDSKVYTGSFSISDIDNYLNTKTNNVFVSRSHGGVVWYTNGTQAGTQIQLNDDSESKITYRSYQSIKTLDLSNMQLIMFIACETGAGGVGGPNLPTVAVERGATTAVGFSEEIGCETANAWTKDFFALMEQGMSVIEACEELGQRPEYASTNMTNYVVCGDPNTRLN